MRQGGGELGGKVRVKDGEATDAEKVRVVVRERGGHPWEGVEASCEEH